MTLNENERNLSSHVILAPSPKDHSDHAEIGTFLLTDLANEPETHWTKLETDLSFEVDDSKVWKMALDKLAQDSRSSCIIGYQKADFDAVFEA